MERPDVEGPGGSRGQEEKCDCSGGRGGEPRGSCRRRGGKAGLQALGEQRVTLTRLLLRGVATAADLHPEVGDTFSCAWPLLLFSQRGLR